VTTDLPREYALRDPAERVSPRARWMWLTGSLPWWLVLVAGAVVGVTLTDVPWWPVVPLALLAAAYVVVMPLWRYRVHRWEVTRTAVYTQTGWWVRERRIAPMSRIQTVDWSQGVWSRVYGLATVTVTTASAAGALTIVGLEKDRAQALAEQLTQQAQATPGDAT